MFDGKSMISVRTAYDSPVIDDFSKYKAFLRLLHGIHDCIIYGTFFNYLDTYLFSEK